MAAIPGRRTRAYRIMKSEGPSPAAWNLRMVAGSYSVSIKVIHEAAVAGFALLENHVVKCLRFGFGAVDGCSSRSVASSANESAGEQRETRH